MLFFIHIPLYDSSRSNFVRGEGALDEWSDEERIFKAVVSGDVEAVRTCIAAGLSASLQDSEVGG